VVVFAAWTASSTPVLASILNAASRPTEQTHPPMWARVEIARPTSVLTPAPVMAQDSPPPASPTEAPPTLAPTSPPAAEPPEAVVASPTPAATEGLETPGVLSMEVLADTPTPLAPPTSAYVQASPKPPAEAPVGNGVRWIDINLSEQRLYAYEGDILQTSFLASTGTWATPTVTGTFQIWNKTRIQDMSGPGYYLPDVPYVMYFYKDYGIHGTYWHNNFGTPMSHGCVNLTIPDSEWLYNWAYVGMTVRVHY
jgi:lipoprotein-anchoring transpeptidase ErfK/SrfK